jgi:hydrogenase maturation protease
LNKKALIIGYGNPIRGDDRVGWEVAERLVCSMGDPSVTIMTVHQLAPELCESIHHADLTIFVDASIDGTPGAWKCDSVEPSATYAPSLGHHFDIAGLLAYARFLYHSCPRAMVVSVTAQSFACRDELSPCVERVVPDVVQFIGEQIAALQGFEPRNNQSWPKEGKLPATLPVTLLLNPNSD